MLKSGVTQHVPQMHPIAASNMQQFMATANIDNNSSNNIKIINNNKNLHTLKMQSLDLNASLQEAAIAAENVATTNSPPDFDFQLPCRYFKSSFARSLSLNNHPSNNQCKSLDFDINQQQQQQRCNNNNNNNNSNMVAKNICQPPSLPQRPSRATMPMATVNSKCGNNNNNTNNLGNVLGIVKNEVSNNSDNATNKLPPPALPARRPIPQMQQQQQQPQHHHHQQQQQQQQQSLTQFRPSIGIANGNATHASHGNFNKIINQQQLPPPSTSSSLPQCNTNMANNNFSRNVWPSEIVEQDCHLCDETEHAPTLAAATVAATTPSEHRASSFEVHHENTMNVEAVILQNQVDTLQWQLKQVETSCEMYRAVMEEVARFLDRYHCQKQQQQQQRQTTRHNMDQISRSKSLYQVYGCGAGHDKNASGDEGSATPTTAYLRARSSTNLIDLKQQQSEATPAAATVDDQNYDSNSYSTFKDFTWRRSPRKTSDNGRANTPGADNLEDKLNKEAFRLSRTILNLLNTSTQQPDLTHHRNSLASSSVSLGRLGKAPNSCTASIMTLHAPMHNSTSLTMATPNADSSGSAASISLNTSKSNNAITAAEMLFLRSAQMRESRLSLRSSTDSSVHSTTSSAASSSSKVETDEDGGALFHHSTTTTHLSNKQLPHLGSTTEDESGFSSISSFQDIGLPLSSTILSNVPPTAACRNSTTLKLESHDQPTNSFNLDSRNSTLRAPNAVPKLPPPSTHPNNVLGVPLNATHDMQHRWDASPAAAAKTYRNPHNNNKFQRFSTLSNEDSATVLWV